jgi:hypothetical protein
MHPFIGINASLLTYLQGAGAAYTKNVGKGDFYMLVFREVNSGDSCQVPDSFD